MIPTGYRFGYAIPPVPGRPVPDAVDNALECVSNQTLCDAMRQLGSLMGHADTLFTELTAECGSIAQRSAALAERMNQLDAVVAKYNPKKEKIRKYSLVSVYMYTIFLHFEIVKKHYRYTFGIRRLNGKILHCKCH